MYQHGLQKDMEISKLLVWILLLLWQLRMLHVNTNRQVTAKREYN